ncbi:hypothetical protein KP509_15G071200 [Ceratopteris richardii]|uniref:RRM domain-containing protein n=1 Tax=Ceratopteris richardii TaxID=49495 RepID=A0A8T2TB30_CERRI|nr:hypothetical protein KP509_15G071200 [Ceratopteris richardii]
MSTLDMALDEIIEMNKQRGAGGGRGRGRGRRGRGGLRRTSYRAALRVRRAPTLGRRPVPFQLAKSFFRRGFNDNGWRREALDDIFTTSARSAGIETGTKLYLSNLDYGVSNEDIKELFSEVGDLKRCGIHYDRSGRSKGTAEVVYARRQDGVIALKRYNNVLLDGKPMKIELIGTNLMPSLSSRGRGSSSLGRSSRTVMGAGRGRGRGRGRGFDRRFRGRARGRGRKGAAGTERKPLPTVEQLNAELEKYHQDAIQTS